MTKILFAIPDLAYGSAAKQLAIVAAGLPRDRFEACVCTLGAGGPVEKSLGCAGVAVERLGWTRMFDVRPFWKLRRLIRAVGPDIIHAWQPSAFRAVVLALGSSGWHGAGLPSPVLVFSAPVAPLQRGAGCFLDRWLFGRADVLTVTGPAEAQRCQRLRLPLEKRAVIPLGVEAGPEFPETKEELLQPLPFASTQGPRWLACVGPLEPHKGFRDAIWAFDILRYLYNDLHLLIIGTGSESDRLRRFIDNTRTSAQVHLLGNRADVRELVRRSEAVWVPGRAVGGRNVALEAMAAGRPVVASRLGELAEIVADGETGILVEPGDKETLARQTRLLLDDGERRRRLGAAGRLRAQNHFAAADVVRRFVQLYETLAQSPRYAQGRSPFR